MKKKEIYDEIFDLYKLNYSSKGEKEKIRKLIMRHLKKEYGEEVKWSELSLLEKRNFSHVLIKDDMLNRYVAPSLHHNIEKRIQNELSTTMHEASLQIAKYNAARSNTYKTYYVQNNSEEEKKNAYEHFCQDIKKIRKTFNIPTYEEWKKQNEPHPLRNYDYLMSDHEQVSFDNDTPYPVPTYRIHETIINTILKIISEKLKVEVDTSLIIECLSFLHEFDMTDEYDEMLLEYDPSLNITKDRQNEIIRNNQKYSAYHQMLETLDFIKK